MSKFVTFIICWMMRILDINGTFHWAIETVCIRTRVTAKEKREYLLHHSAVSLETVNMSVSKAAAMERNARKAEAIYSYFPINGQIDCCSLFKVYLFYTNPTFKVLLVKRFTFVMVFFKLCILPFILGPYYTCFYLGVNYL